MKISFIGAGKVGTAFGKYVSTQHEVVYYSSRTERSAILAADTVGCLWTNSLSELINASEIIFITTSDNAINSVCSEIAQLDVPLRQKHFVHMSGAMTTEVFQSLVHLGATCSSLHPLQTFSDVQHAVDDLKDAYLSLESNSNKLIPMIESMGNPYFTLTKEQKIKYHLSACVFSNYMVTLLNFGSRLLQDIGIEEKEGLQAMKPLIEATLKNVYDRGTTNALTGPIQRGDTETVMKHIQSLESLDLDVYKLLGQQTTKNLIEDQNKKDSLNKIWRS